MVLFMDSNIGRSNFRSLPRIVLLSDPFQVPRSRQIVCRSRMGSITGETVPSISTSYTFACDPRIKRRQINTRDLRRPRFDPSYFTCLSPFVNPHRVSCNPFHSTFQPLDRSTPFPPLRTPILDRLPPNARYHVLFDLLLHLDSDWVGRWRTMFWEIHRFARGSGGGRRSSWCRTSLNRL